MYMICFGYIFVISISDEDIIESNQINILCKDNPFPARDSIKNQNEKYTLLCYRMKIIFESGLTCEISYTQNMRKATFGQTFYMNYKTLP